MKGLPKLLAQNYRGCGHRSVLVRQRRRNDRRHGRRRDHSRHCNQCCNKHSG